MASLLGKNAYVRIITDASTSPPTTSVVGEVRNWSVDTTADVADNTVMGNTWRGMAVTFRSWTGTLEVLYDPENNAQNLLVEGSELVCEFFPEEGVAPDPAITNNPVQPNAGDVRLRGSGIVTSRSQGTPYEDYQTLTISLTGNGELARATS